MTASILAILLAKVLRVIASDPARWLDFRRQLLKVLSSDAEQSRLSALAIARQLENGYNVTEDVK